MADIERKQNKYIPTIGIETHVQLKTKTKLFSAVENDARGASPNTLISHIDVAMPGALPVLNEKAVELAVRTAFVLNATPQKHSYFERKHYFYPDSPAGYQITQLHKPIIIGGSVDIEVDGQSRVIKINRVQLEADAGKTAHPEGVDFSLVDLNRAGTPLLEIVSEPEIHSSAEAKAYVRELYLLMKYADVSNVDLYHGNMRFDVNVSLSAKAGKLGKRTEIKNLNSFKSVEAAIDYEIKRQSKLLDNGEKIDQETRGWDEANQATTAQRSKEEAQDYRYFPDPDIPPLELSDEYISHVQKSVPMLPSQIRKEFLDTKIDSKTVEDILDYPDIAHYLLEVKRNAGSRSTRRAAFLKLHFRSQEIAGEGNLIKISPDRIALLTNLIDEGHLSSTAARTIYEKMLTSDMSPEDIANDLNLLQISDESELKTIISGVIEKNPKAADDVARGEMKAIGFLVGQVMKASGGSANPSTVQKIIAQELGLK